MFTGIITDVGRILAVEQRGDLRLRIGCRYDMSTVRQVPEQAIDGLQRDVATVRQAAHR